MKDIEKVQGLRTGKCPKSCDLIQLGCEKKQFSRQGLPEQLLEAGFPQKQAAYGVKKSGY